MRIPYYMETLEKVEEEEGGAEETSEDPPGGERAPVAPETSYFKSPPQATERPSLKTKKTSGSLEPLAISAMKRAVDSPSPNDNDNMIYPVFHEYDNDNASDNPMRGTNTAHSNRSDDNDGSNSVSNGYIHGGSSDNPENRINSSTNEIETDTNDGTVSGGSHRAPNRPTRAADGCNNATMIETKGTSKPTSVVQDTSLNDDPNTLSESKTTPNDGKSLSNGFITSTNEPANATHHVCDNLTNESNTSIQFIDATEGTKTTTDKSSSDPNGPKSSTDESGNATNATNTTDGPKASTDESDNAPDSITSEINTNGPSMTPNRTTTTPSIGPAPVSNGDEPVSVGALDSLSPCTTPLESTDLEYDNYDGQFVFVGPEFEPRVQMLQQQMSVLADNQTHTDERYSRVKQENAGLQARILMLEEQLRDVEIRAEERLAEEEKRHRELIGRVDREKILQVENCAIRLQNIETENGKLQEDAARLRAALDKAREDNERLTDCVELNEAMIMGLKQDLANARAEERKQKDVIQNQQQIIEELSKDLQIVKQEKATALTALTLSQDKDVTSPLRTELDSLRIQHKELQESHDELQAMLLSQGRSLISSGTSNTLAAEFAAMSQDDAKVADISDLPLASCETDTRNNVPAPSPTKIKSALQEQQEVNAQLRSYIETILTMIMDQQPELLEVKMKKPDGC